MTMKQRLRRANHERHAAVHDKGLIITPPDAVATDDSYSSNASHETRMNSPEKPKQSSKKPQSSPQFLRSFALEFPEEPFQTMPETPSRETPKREPVWKRRLRLNQRIVSSPAASPDRLENPASPAASPFKSSNVSPAASPSKPSNASQHASPLKPSNAVTPNAVSLAKPGLPPKQPPKEAEKEQALQSSEEQHNEREEENHQEEPRDDALLATETVEPSEESNKEKEQDMEDEPSSNPVQKDEEEQEKTSPKGMVVKNVSSDEAGLKEPKKARHKQSSKRRHDKSRKALDEEESVDQLTRTDSHSDIFTNIFDDEDFSIGTPTIYTDATDDNSTLSSYTSRHKSRERLRKKSPKKSRSRVSRYDDESEYDFDFLSSGCRTMAVLDEFKIFSELFGSSNSCNCSKIEDKPSTRRPRGRRTTRSRSRRSRSEG